MSEVVTKILNTNVYFLCERCDGSMEYSDHDTSDFGNTGFLHFCDRCSNREVLGKKYPIHDSKDVTDLI